MTIQSVDKDDPANVIANSDLPPFFKVANPDQVGIAPPPLRRGDALRTWVRTISGFQKEALVTSARTGDTWRMVSDEGSHLNGFDAAPPPLAFLTTGMVAAYMNEVTALAKLDNIAIRKLRLIQNNYYTMHGSMPKRTMVAGALPIDLTVEIDCDLSDAALNQFLMNAVHASPLNGLMRGEHQSLFTLSKNGNELAPAVVDPLDAPMLPDPGDHFAKAALAASPLTMMAPEGLTPEKPLDGGTATPSIGLANEQHRLLNLAAVCTLRDDGLKDIQQLLYSPRGTTFRFLSDEAEVNGGQGGAPDANSYISAGIGFCFMTQFGRFITILKLDLQDYRIVQDTHFSLGGATGGTRQAGTADPVETHVFLTTSESDDVAREMLDISEQTCFLHAFCRTDLKTKLKVVRL